MISAVLTQVLVKKYLKKLLTLGTAGLLFLSASLFLLSHNAALGIVVGYALSFIFVASNFLIVRKIELKDQNEFLTLFFVSITLRFILVLLCFAVVLTVVKIDQILFTISFIISYIFHSVIEIIFINKVLENRPKD